MNIGIEPGILIILYHVSAGIAIGGMVHGIVMACIDDRPRLYWIYAALCANAAAFQIAASMTHTAPTIAAAIKFDKLTIFFGVVWQPLLVALVGIYAQHRLTKLYVQIVATMSAVMIVISLLSPLGGRFINIQELGLIELPWGERLHIITGQISVISYVGRFMIFTVYLWGVQQAIRIYRHGERLAGSLIGAAFLCLIMNMIASTLKDWGVIKSLYTGGFAFLFLILCFTILVGRNFKKTRQSLSYIKGNLSHELASHQTTRAELEYLAYHDLLTNLPNRTGLIEHLNNLVAADQKKSRRFAVLNVDIDHFGVINDTLGHDIGDKLLSQLAPNLKSQVRDDDYVARLSNDAFVVVVKERSMTYDPGMLAERLLKALRRPFQIDDQSLNITASIGIAIFPDDANTVSSLLAAANMASHEAKRHGRNQVQHYRHELSEVIQDRHRLGIALQTALVENQFELHYQPIVHALNGHVMSLEALIRWRHPTEGMIPPNRFIPIAEETQLILPIGAWVIKEACKTLAQWRQAGITDISVAINLSAHQLFQANLCPMIADTLSQYELRGDDIELEITESVVMKDPETSRTQLKELRDLGVRISIDDFGTGYSSLSYLKLLPVDTLKIDRSFVADIESDTNDAIICATAINMAIGMDLKTVAEGVETQEQADFLRRLGCNFLQGYLYAKPMPADQVPAFIARQNAMNPAREIFASL